MTPAIHPRAGSVAARVIEHLEGAPASLTASDFGLTAREIEALQFIADGQTCEQIAKAIGVHRASAEAYVKRATKRLGARGRTHAVAEAIRKGLIE